MAIITLYHRDKENKYDAEARYNTETETCVILAGSRLKPKSEASDGYNKKYGEEANIIDDLLDEENKLQCDYVCRLTEAEEHIRRTDEGNPKEVYTDVRDEQGNNMGLKEAEKYIMENKEKYPHPAIGECEQIDDLLTWVKIGKNKNDKNKNDKKREIVIHALLKGCEKVDEEELFKVTLGKFTRGNQSDTNNTKLLCTDDEFKKDDKSQNNYYKNIQEIEALHGKLWDKK